jgi:hypothetical protein
MIFNVALLYHPNGYLYINLSFDDRNSLVKMDIAVWVFSCSPNRHQV